MIHIRPYEPADREPLETMYDEFDPHHCAQGIPPTTPVRRANWLDTILADGVHVVADLDGRIVGHCLYTPRGHPEPELAVFVHQDVHDRGIGTELCRHVVDAAARTGRRALLLEVERHNRVAVHVYRSLGFESVARHRRELRMRLPLMAESPSNSPSSTADA